jgi:tripartite-type tricarboxylate transporter receptor subunit TctC
VPTVAEAANLPGFEAIGWAGLVAPAQTPRAVVTKLADEALQALRDPAIAARITELGASPAPLGPSEFGGFIASELRKWRAVAEAGQVTLD